MVLVIVPRLGETVSMFVNVLPQSAADLSSALQGFLQRFRVPDETMQSISAYISGLAQQVVNMIKESTGTIANYVLSTVVSAFSTIMNIVFAVIVAIYVLYGKEKNGAFVRKLMLRFLPEKTTKKIIRVAKLSFTTFANFVRGQLLQALILGVMCFLGMLLLGFPMRRWYPCSLASPL